MSDSQQAAVEPLTPLYLEHERTRRIYQGMITLCAPASHWCLISDEKDELMKLYEQKFGTQTDTTRGCFTREQQIEQFAQNFIFWRRLIKEYPNEDQNCVIKYKDCPRWRFIFEKEQELLHRLFLTCRFDPELHKRILSRCEQLDVDDGLEPTH
jgi:hypothetical protein